MKQKNILITTDNRGNKFLIHGDEMISTEILLKTDKYYLLKAEKYKEFESVRFVTEEEFKSLEANFTGDNSKEEVSEV